MVSEVLLPQCKDITTGEISRLVVSQDKENALSLLKKKMHKVNWVADEQVLTYTWPKFRSNYAVASSQVCPNSHNPRSYSLSRNTVENRRGQRTHHPARHLPNRIGVAGSRRPRPTLPLQPRHQRQSRDGPRLPPATAAIGP